uniref:Uncharacterized protein n=1 Tax=Arundo donax TaxID=35708 RepID=A0A0A9H1J2_ARUDO
MALFRLTCSSRIFLKEINKTTSCLKKLQSANSYLNK